VSWLQRMYERGAVLGSACSGIFLLAETGLYDGKEATVHFGYARAFSDLYPKIAIHPKRVLVVAGRREELVSSGASTTWHDLVLYLIARHAGATTAQELARLFALQWHQDGLAPYIVFEGKNDHGDGEILSAQRSAGASATKIRHFSGACSSVSRAWRQGRTANGFASPSSRVRSCHNRGSATRHTLEGPRCAFFRSPTSPSPHSASSS
jgi:hypothetical protein